MIAEARRRDQAEFCELVTARVTWLADGLPPELGALARSLAARPGKLLRPTLLHACAGLGQPDPARLVRLGALVELLHLASLLHDDIIDQQATRRGGPAAHTVAGHELAMLAGLGCFALAGTEAADLGQGVGLLVGQAAARLSYGELLDVERAFDVALPLPDYLELVERKTADLFRLSCLLGAAEAGLDTDVAQALGSFGRDIGVAFQILDDCLDLDLAAANKPAGIDHMLGLFGAPTLHALAADSTGELAALLLSPEFGADDMPAVRALVAARGGLAAAVTLARERYDRALAWLELVPVGSSRDHLAAVAGLAWRDQP
jgi:heptaprenyl diphosphate synthase